MSRIDFSRRGAHLEEHMDAPDCDPALLRETYRQFVWVNRFFSGWRHIYTHHLRPVLRSESRRWTVLDVGCGAGDIPVRLAQWAARDGLDVAVTAIDPDPRSIDYATKRYGASGINFRCVALDELVAQGAQYDLVLSNHVLHHLSDQERDRFVEDSKQVARRYVAHGDIERSGWAYHMFRLAMFPLFWNSFIVSDGLISIRRSYTAKELQETLPPAWKVKRFGLFRLLAVCDLPEPT